MEGWEKNGYEKRNWFEAGQVVVALGTSTSTARYLQGKVAREKVDDVWMVGQMVGRGGGRGDGGLWTGDGWLGGGGEGGNLKARKALKGTGQCVTSAVAPGGGQASFNSSGLVPAR